ncbi:hypothetical protein [Cupriavidus metallidurans]|uniref:hypothetical protein n=1 Tax=Cupriavidus metallidurans TaxID=119219 RepID=UPI000CE04F86|nr:hypothetical protein [Cupriavidus metallidurans]AVA33431.1 hypothetical protein C3Z06_07195 [Cupriavidus metallidurans]
MSAGRPVNAKRPSTREAIIRAAEDHAPDANRMLVLIRLARLMKNDESLMYMSVEWIAHHTRLGVSTIERIVAEFRRHGIMEWTGDVMGKMGTKVYRIHPERIVTAYPAPESWKERQARSQAQFKAVREKYRLQQLRDNAPPYRGSVDDDDAPPHRGSADAIATRDARVNDASTLPHSEGHAPSLATPRSLIDAPHAPSLTTPRSLAVGDKGLKAGFKAGAGFEKQGEVRGPHGRARLVDFAARSSTDVCPAIGANGVEQNAVAMVLTHPVIRDLDEVLRLRADDLLQVLARDHALPVNGTAVKRVACALAELANARCTTELMRTAIYRVRERGNGTYSKVLAEARQALKLRAVEDDTDDIPFAPEPLGRLQ